MDDKRKFARLNINVVVRWEKIGKVRESIVDSSLSKNISAGGICLILYGEKVEVGDLLKLELQLAKDVISAKGKVVWVSEFEIVGDIDKKKYDVGVEFVEINDEYREKIKKFVFAVFNEEY